MAASRDPATTATWYRAWSPQPVATFGSKNGFQCHAYHERVTRASADNRSRPVSSGPGTDSPRATTTSRTRKPVSSTAKPQRHVQPQQQAPATQYTSPLLAKLHQLLSEYEAGLMQHSSAPSPTLESGDSTPDTPVQPPASQGLSEAGLQGALSHLAATSPHLYADLLRAAAATSRPLVPQLPPPYAALAGQPLLRPAHAVPPLSHPVTNRAQRSASKSSSRVTQLAEQLSRLTQVPADTLLQAASQDDPDHPSPLSTSTQPSPAHPSSSTAAWEGAATFTFLTAGLHAAHTSQTLGPEERRVVRAMRRDLEEDGGPPMGSVERALWDQAQEQGQCIRLHTGPTTVPGWIDSPQVYPVVMTFLPWDIYSRGRAAEPPPLKWPYAAGQPVHRGPRAGRVIWCINSRADITALLSTTQSVQPVIPGLMGWSGSDTLDCVGPVEVPAAQSTATHSSGSVAAGAVGPGEAQAEESDDVRAVRAAVHAVRLTLQHTYLDTMELHVYAPEAVWRTDLGPAAVRLGASHMDLVTHALTHQARATRLAQRRRRDWRLVRRAGELRARTRAYGAPVPEPAPAVAAAQLLDELDAWSEHLNPLNPDYPAELQGLPEKDLLHAVQTGRLPPRYKRLAAAHNSRAATRSSGGLPGQQLGQGAGSSGSSGGGAQEEDFETRVLGALDTLQQRVAMPWTECPGQPAVKRVNLMELLLSLGVLPHVCSDTPGPGTEPEHNQGASCMATAASDLQTLVRLAPRIRSQDQDPRLSDPRLALVLVGADRALVDCLGNCPAAQVAIIVVTDDEGVVQHAQDLRAGVVLSQRELFSGSYLPGSGVGPATTDSSPEPPTDPSRIGTRQRRNR